MGKVLRGKGTVQEWTVALELSQAQFDTYATAKTDSPTAGRSNSLTKEERAQLATCKEALPKVVFINALTRRASLRHAGPTEEERAEWVKKHTFGMGFTEASDGHGNGYGNIHKFMETIGRLIHNWPVLSYLAKTNPEGARVFTRRQSTYEDAHVGVHVGSSGGMPRNYYSSVTILPSMRDSDLTYLTTLYAKLKPLTDLLLQTRNAGSMESAHQRDIKEMEMHAEKINSLNACHDEWVRQDTEVRKWLDSRPDSIPDGRFNIQVRDGDYSVNTYYQLLGRRTWQAQMNIAVRQYGVYSARVEAYTPDITATMIDQAAVKKGITQVMEEAVKWACAYEIDFTKDGGEEQ